MLDVAARLKNRVQFNRRQPSALLRPYLEAVENAFVSEIDFSQLIKIYGGSIGGSIEDAEIKYSQAVSTGEVKKPITGHPDLAHVSTSYVERQNLTMRLSMRRFIRLTNTFSKKIENLEHAVALHFMYYNFCQVHQTLRVTPAMEAKIADHVWTIEDILKLME